MSKRIYLSPPHLNGIESDYLSDVISDNWLAPKGKYIDLLKSQFINYTRANYVSTTNSGTAALHLALRLLDVQEGDHIICPDFTFIASVNPILYQKAKPVFIDSETESWNMCPIRTEYAIQKLIQRSKKPKAMIVAHIYGLPAAIKAFRKIAEQYEIPLIEDAAEALGAKVEEKQLGTWGDLGIYSFNSNKMITGGGGGLLLCKKEEHANKASYLAHQAKRSSAEFIHEELGYNYAMTQMQAAMVSAQMHSLDDYIEKRRSHFDYYRSHLEHLPGLSFCNEVKGHFSNRWLTCLLVDKQVCGVDKYQIHHTLNEHAIESRFLWCPMHLQPVFKKYPSTELFPVSEKLYREGLALPSGSNLERDDLDRIIEVIRSLFR